MHLRISFKRLFFYSYMQFLKRHTLPSLKVRNLQISLHVDLSTECRIQAEEYVHPGLNPDFFTEKGNNEKWVFPPWCTLKGRKTVNHRNSSTLCALYTVPGEHGAKVMCRIPCEHKEWYHDFIIGSITSHHNGLVAHQCVCGRSQRDS